MPKFTSVDAYLAAQPEPQRTALARLRSVVKAAAPQAIETIAYDMPAYRLGDRFLVSFAGFRRHCSLFPASRHVQDVLGDEVRPYVAGKGTFQFRPDAPMPDDLVRRIVGLRIDEVGDQRAAADDA